MMKKLTMLALAVGALVAFAVPAAASAVEWKHEGNPLGANEIVEFTGPACFSVGLAGACADLDIEVELFAGSDDGKVTSFVATDCTGTGQLAGLTCTNTPVAEWAVEARADGTILIDNISLTNHYYHPTDTAHAKILASSTLIGDIIATPDNSEAIGSVTLEGSGTTVGGNPASVTGELEAAPAGTIGIG